MKYPLVVTRDYAKTRFEKKRRTRKKLSSLKRTMAVSDCESDIEMPKPNDSGKTKLPVT